jgi:hypothetical protein
MGLFDGIKKENDEAQVLLDRHEKKELNDTDFLKAFRGVVLYYTTPVGDHKDGGMRLFAIPGPDKTGYMPLFLSEEDMRNYYDQAGRVGYMIMNAPFLLIIEAAAQANSGDAPVKLGLMIDPLKYKVTLDVPMIEPVIRLLHE